MRQDGQGPVLPNLLTQNLLVMSSPRLLSSLLLIASLFSVTASFTQLSLPAVFSDNMVLQSGKPVNIWGNAKASEQVTVSFGRQKQQTKADSDGRWRVVLGSLAPSSVAQNLVVTAGNTITLKNILVGEVCI
jgi:sialate O-acetylesterase